jgi:hypothetical protein
MPSHDRTEVGVSTDVVTGRYAPGYGLTHRQLRLARLRAVTLTHAAKPVRTYRTEPAITCRLLDLLVRKGVTPALSGVHDGRNRQGHAPIMGRIDLLWRFKSTMTPYLNFRAAGPRWAIRRLST